MPRQRQCCYCAAAGRRVPEAAAMATESKPSSTTKTKSLSAVMLAAAWQRTITSCSRP